MYHLCVCVCVCVCLCVCVYLQVVDVVPCVQVDAHGLLLDSHDGQPGVDATVQLSLPQLAERVQESEEQMHVLGMHVCTHTVNVFGVRASG